MKRQLLATVIFGAIALFALSAMAFADGKDIFDSTWKSKGAVAAYRLCLAHKNDPRAQTLLGYFYRTTGGGVPGVPQDDKESTKWYRLAANQGYPEGQVEFACLLRDGDGVSQNAPEAIKLFKLAAAKGDDRGAYFLGEMYDRGKGAPREVKEAIKWYKTAANLIERKLKSGVAANTELDVPTDDEVAVDYYRKAADRGYGAAEYSLAVAYERGDWYWDPQDIEKSEKCYLRAAEMGDAVAQYLIGLKCLTHSNNHEEAFKWFKLAAAQGNAGGICWLAEEYASGEGTLQDKAED